jgi:hypothetical protein
VALRVYRAHEVGEVGAKHRVRAGGTALTRVPRLKAGVRDLSHFVGEVYDYGAHGDPSRTEPTMILRVSVPLW